MFTTTVGRHTQSMKGGLEDVVTVLGPERHRTLRSPTPRKITIFGLPTSVVTPGTVASVRSLVGSLPTTYIRYRSCPVGREPQIVHPTRPTVESLPRLFWSHGVFRDGGVGPVSEREIPGSG